MFSLLDEAIEWAEDQVIVRHGGGTAADRGMEFGEMALLDERRTADVWADTDVTCLELPIEEFDRFRREHPHIGEHIARNLAAILARRLILANAKIDLLSA